MKTANLTKTINLMKMANLIKICQRSAFDRMTSREECLGSGEFKETCSKTKNEDQSK